MMIFFFSKKKWKELNILKNRGNDRRLKHHRKEEKGMNEWIHVMNDDFFKGRKKGGMIFKEKESLKKKQRLSFKGYEWIL